jgi:hypothetical protein
MDGAKGKDEACKDRPEMPLREVRLRETHRSVEAAPLQNLFCRLQPARIEPTKALRKARLRETLFRETHAMRQYGAYNDL